MGLEAIFVLTLGQMMEEMIRQYLEHHFKPNQNDNFKIEPDQDTSYSQGVSGFSARNSNSPTLAGDLSFIFSFHLVSIYFLSAEGETFRQFHTD